MRFRAITCVIGYMPRRGETAKAVTRRVNEERRLQAQFAVDRALREHGAFNVLPSTVRGIIRRMVLDRMGLPLAIVDDESLDVELRLKAWDTLAKYGLANTGNSENHAGAMIGVVVLPGLPEDGYVQSPQALSPAYEVADAGAEDSTSADDASAA